MSSRRRPRRWGKPLAGFGGWPKDLLPGERNAFWFAWSAILVALAMTTWAPWTHAVAFLGIAAAIVGWLVLAARSPRRAGIVLGAVLAVGWVASVVVVLR